MTTGRMSSACSLARRQRAPRKYLERHREGDAPAEEPASDEEHRREEDEGDDDLLLFLVEAGRDERPELVEDDRGREQQPADQRQLEVGVERVARRGEVERRISADIFCARHDSANGLQSHARIGSR